MDPISLHLRSSSSSSDTNDNNNDNMTETQQRGIKMEDVHSTSSVASPSPTPAEQGSTWSTETQHTIVVHSKPAKKRKSWGQELPTPKTTLPPRKRAKTEDEKEQRRIERIKRNRAAAHNSRERKRRETENLAVKLARANAELAAYKKHFGALPSHIVLPTVTLEIDGDGNEHVREYPAQSPQSSVPDLTDSGRSTLMIYFPGHH